MQSLLKWISCLSAGAIHRHAVYVSSVASYFTHVVQFNSTIASHSTRLAQCPFFLTTAQLPSACLPQPGVLGHCVCPHHTHGTCDLDQSGLSRTSPLSTCQSCCMLHSLTQWREGEGRPLPPSNCGRGAYWISPVGQTVFHGIPQMGFNSIHSLPSIFGSSFDYHIAYQCAP